MSQSEGKWFFIKEDPNDRLRATVRRHALGGSELAHEARVVREAIQNSVDATLENQKTNVLVWNRVVSGEDVETFREQIGFGNSDSPFSRIKYLGLRPGNALERMKSGKKSEQKFNFTIIEDRNTVGLGYSESEAIDRFDELCLSYGQDHTAVDPTRGGSYGFGKSVYEEASDCNMFVVYSVFSPNPATADNEVGSHARLFACATFRGHTFGSTKYRGRALFGVHKKSGSQTECRPIVDEEAHEIAGRLGFVRRDPKDTGTSIMIVGSNIDTSKLKEATEDYWWPRLYSNLLSVELWDDDNVAGHPDPKTREDLKPYLRCYSLIDEGVAKSESERLHILRNNSPLLQQGKLALTPLPEAADNSDESEQDTYLESTVALIRSRPRMVVRYLDPGGRSTANFAGVFLSHPEIEEQLHLSEPAAHDNWSPDASRIAESYPDEPDKQEETRRLVNSLLSKIKNSTRSFRQALSPTIPPRPMTGSRTLQNILGRIMSGESLGPQLIPRRKNLDPFTINIRTGRKNTSNSSRVTAKIDVTLNERAPTHMAKATMTIEPYLAMDDDIKRDSQGILKLDDVSLDREHLKHSDNCIQITLSKHEATSVEVTSETFPRDLYAGLDVDVKIDRFDPIDATDESRG